MTMSVVVVVIHYISIVPFLGVPGFGSQCGMRRRFLVCLGLFGIAFGGSARLFGQAADQTASPAAAETPEKKGRPLLASIGDSMKLLMIEHSTRILFQEKTRRELGGPFWGDYRSSIRFPRRWEDSDAWWVNYIGHPIHGAAAGLIYLDHTPEREDSLSLRRAYWSSRGKATAFSAIYSLQFEIGPLSEASIGNVGQRPETTGWVDYVVTPTGAFALLVAEDALDRWFVEWIERHTDNRAFRASIRMVFNPSRTFANIAQTKAPWYRQDRPLR
jgi:hypothetical protein